MLEVEKKFTLSKEQENNLKENLTFISKKQIIDSYYDNKNCDLTRNCDWLRERDGRFELKVCKDKNVDRKADQFEEITNEAEIRDYLKLKEENSFTNDLEKAGYLPFCKLKTVRSKFKNPPFILDIDEVTSDDFFYGLAEIELMVEDESEIGEAIGKIMNFAKSQGLKTGIYTRGKVIEYIRLKRPEHFKILVESKVVK